MQSMAKHFSTLQLPSSASADDVRKSYRKLALQHHPDKNPGEAQDEAVRRFREVADAYKALCEFFEKKDLKK